MDKNFDVITFILKHLYFKAPRVANFYDIIKIATMLIKKKCLKTQAKLKELEVMY